MKKGKFIVLEGGDGCGKSTQIKLLKDALEQRGIKVHTTREPGGTIIGEKIREILLNPSYTNMDDICELLLYMAARRQYIVEVIQPNLENGTWILSERFVLSTYAYQGYGNEMDINLIRKLEEIVVDNIQPDLTFVLDLSPEEGFKRRGQNLDRMEKKGLSYHKKVLQGYKKLAKEMSRCYIINARNSIEEIHNQIIHIINEQLF